MSKQQTIQKFHRLTSGDRKPEHLPLAEGWDWYQYSDGVYSTRWITDGTIIRCTNCGREDNRIGVIRRHNGLIHPEKDSINEE